MDEEDVHESIDFREAVNAVSDVVQNRPAPLREFDQIYMKAGDLVTMAIYVARKYADQHVVFIGDGDGIALAVMHLTTKGIVRRGPASVLVLDFDERIVMSIKRFADTNEIEDRISARLYNVCDPLPEDIVGTKDAFYTNPPWGASNGGESVLAFVERGIEAIHPRGMGAVVIGDDHALQWTKDVLASTQRRGLELGFIVSEMIPKWHLYHLDDAPDLRSCVVLLQGINDSERPKSEPLSEERRLHFYGRESPLIVRYVRERETLNYGKAPDSTYELERIVSDA
jgi:predicted methyltransferase